MRGVRRGVGRRYLFIPQRAAFGGVGDWGVLESGTELPVRILGFSSLPHV